MCGGRDYADRAYLFRRLDEIDADRGIAVVISGTASGADTFGEEWAAARGREVERYPALWHRHGRAAGPIRNRQMLVEGRADLVIAFHPDIARSKGTADMVRQARKAGVEVIVN